MHTTTKLLWVPKYCFYFAMGNNTSLYFIKISYLYAFIFSK